MCGCRTSKQAVEEQRRVEESLSEEVEVARSRMSEINSELETVVEQLGEAKVKQTLTSSLFIEFSQFG